jgi:hypothetical protein
MKIELSNEDVQLLWAGIKKLIDNPDEHVVALAKNVAKVIFGSS